LKEAVLPAEPVAQPRAPVVALLGGGAGPTGRGGYAHYPDRAAVEAVRHIPGDGSFVDETYVKIAGRWTYL
jgi:hypothetical protein